MSFSSRRSGVFDYRSKYQNPVPNLFTTEYLTSADVFSHISSAYFSYTVVSLINQDVLSDYFISFGSYVKSLFTKPVNQPRRIISEYTNSTILQNSVKAITNKYSKTRAQVEFSLDLARFDNWAHPLTHQHLLIGVCFLVTHHVSLIFFRKFFQVLDTK